jgi:hypothetical protein
MRWLTALALVTLLVPVSTVVSPEHAAFAAQRKQTAVERYLDNLVKKFKSKTASKPKTAGRPKTAKKPVRKRTQTAVRPKTRAVAVLVPKPVPRPPLPEWVKAAKATPPAAFESESADAPVAAAEAEVASRPESALRAPSDGLAATGLAEPSASEAPEPPVSDPGDPRSRKTEFGVKTALLVLPRPRPPRPLPETPSADQPRAPDPLNGNLKWQAAEIRSARLACEAELTGLDVAWKEENPLGGPRGCGAAAPIRIGHVAGIKLSPPAIANCRMAAAFHRWVQTVVQPAAERTFGERVTGIAVAASYDCRYRYNARGGKISEHARANAIDISGFTLASGRRIQVLGGWSAVTPVSLHGGAGFLRGVHRDGCKMFSTVLGPEANAAHASHFHFDLQARNRRGRFCE